MRILLRTLRLLAISVWLGSLVFFAFVLAPTAFSPAVVQQTHSQFVSGLIVGTSLSNLHWIGIVSAIILFITIWQLRRSRGIWQLTAVAIMLLLTAFSQFWIIPRMDRDRVQAGGDINAVAPDNPARQDFDRLHPLSEKVEGLVLLAGIILTVLVAAESSPQPNTID
jgi:hypothetical protein